MSEQEQTEVKVEVEVFSTDFEGMVRILFKKYGMHKHHEGIMHAAIGISGEAGEIFEEFMNEVPNQEHLVEEFGDLEFYIEALRQAVGISEDAISGMYTILLQKEPGRAYTLGDLVTYSTALLDAAKRCWVYGKTLDEMYEKFSMNMAHLILCVDQMYKASGTGLKEIRYKNQVKLIGKNGRYSNMSYSDFAANARADKQGEQP